MADYISREWLLSEYDKRHKGPPGGARKMIEEAPAADVRPVKEGRWIKARGSWCTPGGDPVWECSECGKGVHVYGIEHGRYGSDIADGQWVSCPNCVAKMGGTDGRKE